MLKWKSIHDDDLIRIAKIHHVPVSKLKDLIVEWEYNLSSINEILKNDPEPQDLSIRTKEWAELLIFYYENESELELEEPNIFEVVFKSHGSKSMTVKLSKFHSNQIIKKYLKLVIKNKIDKKLAIRTLAYYNNKRAKKYKKTFYRDELIISGVLYLKSHNINFYAGIISDLLNKMGFGDFKQETIRQIYKRSLNSSNS